MADYLKDLLEQPISIVTNDGRCLLGKLKGFDHAINIVLAEATERVFSPDKPVEVVPLGLFLVRGDNIAVIGEVDAEADASIAWEKDVKGTPLGPIQQQAIA